VRGDRRERLGAGGVERKYRQLSGELDMLLALGSLLRVIDQKRTEREFSETDGTQADLGG
jgi:hypothetical protein